MLKFFRKYNTIILVVFGSLLMVAFLVPEAIQRIGQNPKGLVVARLGDKVIRTLDYQFARQELRALGNLAPQLVGPGGALGLGDERNDDAHWILLTKAAEDAGMIGESGDGKSWIGGLTDQLAVLYAANALSTDVGRAQQFLFQNPLVAQTFFSQAQKAAITAPIGVFQLRLEALQPRQQGFQGERVQLGFDWRCLGGGFKHRPSPLQ